MKAVRIDRSSPSYNQLRHTVLYGGDDVYGYKNRRDGVLFQLDGSIKIGLLQCVFSSKRVSSHSNVQLALIRLLKDVPPDDNNRLVVDLYGHTRLAYDLSENNIVRTVLVDSKSLTQQFMVVPDPFWIVNSQSEYKKFDDVADDEETQSKIKFFSVINFSVFKHFQFKGRKRNVNSTTDDGN